MNINSPGDANEKNPVHCYGCDEIVIAAREHHKEKHFRTTHKCPKCGYRGSLLTINGIPQLRHPGEIPGA